MRTKAFPILIVVLILIILAGFYLILDNVGRLRNEVKNLELAIELSKKTDNLDIQAEEKTQEPELPKPTAPQSANQVTTIPTSVIVETMSGLALSPQTKLTVTLDSLTKGPDGTITLNIKVFTSEATSYSAWEPRDFFEIVTLTGGGNLRTVEVKGQFNSMPPKSSVSGNLIFKTDPSAKNLILQVGPAGSAKYYDFNFLKKTYEETVIG